MPASGQSYQTRRFVGDRLPSVRHGSFDHANMSGLPGGCCSFFKPREEEEEEEEEMMNTESW